MSVNTSNVTNSWYNNVSNKVEFELQVVSIRFVDWWHRADKHAIGRFFCLNSLRAICIKNVSPQKALKA